MENQIMAKYTKEELKEIYRQRKELFLLLLKKTNTTQQDVYRAAEEDFVIANLDELTASEKKKFDKLVFSK